MNEENAFPKPFKLKDHTRDGALEPLKPGDYMVVDTSRDTLHFERNGWKLETEDGENEFKVPFRFFDRMSNRAEIIASWCRLRAHLERVEPGDEMPDDLQLPGIPANLNSFLDHGMKFWFVFKPRP